MLRDIDGYNAFGDIISTITVILEYNIHQYPISMNISLIAMKQNISIYFYVFLPYIIEQ